jgi:hypothetical protein
MPDTTYTMTEDLQYIKHNRVADDMFAAKVLKDYDQLKYVATSSIDTYGTTTYDIYFRKNHHPV